MRVKSWLKGNKGNRGTTKYSEAKNIGVIFCINESSDLSKINSFIRRIKEDNKEVNVLAYFPKKEEEYSYDYTHFTPKQISFWGNINADAVNKFTNQSFDYLFHLDENTPLVMKGILAQSKAKCRIGRYNEENAPFYELMINPEKNDYFTEIYNYTSILN